jgi:hypothetical protein
VPDKPILPYWQLNTNPAKQRITGEVLMPDLAMWLKHAVVLGMTHPSYWLTQRSKIEPQKTGAVIAPALAWFLCYLYCTHSTATIILPLARPVSEYATASAVSARG